MKRFAIPGTLIAMLLVAGPAFAQTAAEPIHFSKLLPFLPDKVEGFAAENPEGSTTSAMGFKVTEVSRSYRSDKEGAGERVRVKITDGTGNQMFAAAHAAVMQFSSESTEGFEKGFTLDGYPAIEKYTYESKSGSLTVFVARRYLVEIDASGLDSSALREWWKKVDVKKLAELKAS